MEMEIINPDCAGIDVGSRSHYVAIGQSIQDVREFGVYSEDQKQLCEWLLENGIRSVALESTGSYWQTLHSELISYGLEVTLCNGKFTKNIKGKKTDVMDCMWIQKLHSLGLLSGSFLPDWHTEQLRTYGRQRARMIEKASMASNKMQEYLRLLNLRLDIVVKDICGKTGMNIIREICSGVSDPEKLADLRDARCKKSKQEIAKALRSNGRADYLFCLKLEYESYCYIQTQIEECDRAIAELLSLFNESKPQQTVESKTRKKVNKNDIRTIDLKLASKRYFEGIDLTAIEGVSYMTVMSIISEIGPEGFKKFDSAKKFTNWLRLAPNNKISGGKVLSNRVPKGSNRLKIALRQAANTVERMKDNHLSVFFKRIAYRKGRVAAISATARKIAIIIWNMVVKRQQYIPSKEHELNSEIRRQKEIRQIENRLKKHGIKPEEISFSTS